MCPLVGVPLEGCHEAEPLCRGCHWEAAAGPAPGVILAGRQGVEVPGDFLRGSCGGVLRCQVPHDRDHRPGGEGPRPWGGAHLDGPLWVRPLHAGCVEHPSDHVRRQDQPFPRGPQCSPLQVCRGGPGCARPLPLVPRGRLGRRPPGCSRCRVRSHPGCSPAPLRSVGRHVRPRVLPRAALRHRGRTGGAVWGTGLRRCSGPVSTRNRGWARCRPAAQVPRACCPWRAPVFPPGRSPCPPPLVGDILGRL